MPIRRHESKIEVLLLARSNNDVFWHGGLHIPGCVVRPDDTFDDVKNRLINEELQGIKVRDLYFLLVEIRKSKRGNEQAQVFMLEVEGDAPVGKFYPINALPNNIVEGQERLINLAAKHITS